MFTTNLSMDKKIFSLLLFWMSLGYGQYEPQAINYGITVSKTLGSAGELGGGTRIEYAYNCYTTFMGEYNRFFSLGDTEDIEATGYNEFAFGVNIIMFNWYPTTIMGGIGYVGNDSKFFETIEDEAFLFFKTGDIIHGVQLKIRALHQIVPPVHLFAEFNLKSTGRRYDTVSIGVSYDFEE